MLSELDPQGLDLLVSHHDSWEEPVNFDSRTNQTLPPHESKVQYELNRLHEYAIENEIKINIKKSKVMLFNSATTRDFSPEILIENETLEVVEEMKLLGVKITTDMKWHRNTEHITKSLIQDYG